MLMLNPPPRPVPTSLLLRLVAGHLVHQIGWALVALGLSLAWGIYLEPTVAAFGPSGPFGLFAVVPGGAGLALIAVGLWLGWRKLRLLRDGLLASAKFVDRKETTASVNDQVVWALDYVFRGDDMHEHHTLLRTHQPQGLGETDQQVLFAPGQPDRALVVATLAGKLRVDPSGNPAPVGYIAALLLPVAVAVAVVVSIAAFLA